MQRRDFLKQSTVAVAAATLSRTVSALPAATSGRPNLLFITVDDMDAALPGFMGNKLGLTPNLDRLAAGSHRFVNNRTTAPICQPSREAMMTGRVPHRSGGLGFVPIHEGVPTLVTILKDAGYFTAAIHKTEHMRPPVCFPWNSELKGNDRKPSVYSDGMRAAIDAARASKQPFFINCNLNDPHRPFYGSTDVYIGTGKSAMEMDHCEQGEYHIERELTGKDIEVPDILEDLPDVRTEYAQYCNSAQRMDFTIGKILHELEISPEAANTIVFFSADHGMPMPFSKATCYSHGTHTPALLKYPSMTAPKQFESRTINIDYMPTLLDLMDVPKPEGMDGSSWMPLLQGTRKEIREYVITHVNGISSGAQYPMRAIHDDRYTLVFTPWSDGSFELKNESMVGLTYPAMHRAAADDPRIAARVRQYIIGTPLAFYDLKKDPSQRHNLINQPEHKARVEAMKKSLLASMKLTNDPQTSNFELLLAGKTPIVVQPDPSQIRKE